MHEEQWARWDVPPRRRRPSVTVLVTAALAATLLVAAGAWEANDDPPTDVHRAALRVPVPSRLPAPPADARPDRILPPVHAASSGPHAFVATLPDGSPVGYDPCRPVHYVVNPDRGADDGTQIIAEAVAAVSAATGLAFVFDGEVSDPVVQDSSLVTADGDAWAPVIIGWTDESAWPELAGDTIGLGGSQSVAVGGPDGERYVTGSIALDAREMAVTVHLDHGHAEARAIVMHELGHVVGLDHVQDDGELMAEDNDGQTGWGPGDLEGLAAVGAAPCRTDT